MSLTLLSNALRHAVRLRLIPHNPAADIPKAKPRDKEIDILSAAQCKKRSRRHAGPFEHDTAGPDERLLADHAAVQEHRAHSDETAVLDGRAMKDHPVPHGHLIAHDDRHASARQVQHAAVLDVAPPSDADRSHVAADHGAVPDAGLFPQNDIAHHDGGGRDENGFGDAGRTSLERRDERSGHGRAEPYISSGLNFPKSSGLSPSR